MQFDNLYMDYSFGICSCFFFNLLPDYCQQYNHLSHVLNGLICQVAEPLRAMVMGSPLEDARHLAQRYDRMRQEAESQVLYLTDVLDKCLY